MAHELNIIQATRRLAESLSIPIFIVDGGGTLLFYNQPAETILGKEFGSTGEMPASVWARLFTPTDEDGNPMLPETLPLMITLNERRPAMGRFWIEGLDNQRRHIEVSAFPLTSRANLFLGAVAMFWDVP